MSWEQVRLGDHVKTSSGGTPSRSNASYWGGKIPWIKSGQLKDGPINEAEEYITEDGLNNSSAKLVTKGTLLLALYGATAGKLGFLGIDATLNQAICSLTPDPTVFDNRFLYYYLLSNRSRIISDSFGGAQPNISQNYVREMKVPRPPLIIQKNIADILDKSYTLRRKDQQLLQKYEELRESIFYDMFGDPVINNKGWGVQKLGNLTSLISSGSTPLGGQRVYQDSGILFLRSQNILMNKIVNDPAIYISNEIHNNMKRTWVKNKDVLLNITGASIGRVATYYGKDNNANVNQHVCIIRLNKEIAVPEYIASMVAFPSYQDRIIGGSTGGTRESFTFQKVKNFDVILPPFEMQLKYHDAISNITAQYKTTVQAQEESMNLFKALVNKYIE